MSEDPLLAIAPWLDALDAITDWDLRPAPLPCVIMPHLMLSDLEAAVKLESLKKLGITHILNAASEIGPQTRERAVSSGFHYLHLRAEDEAGYDMMQHLDLATAFIEQARTGGGRCVVHCYAGVNRSGLLAVASLMLHERLGVVEAFQRCKLARGVILENESFRIQLVRLAERSRLLGPKPQLPIWPPPPLDSLASSLREPLAALTEELCEDDDDGSNEPASLVPDGFTAIGKTAEELSALSTGLRVTIGDRSVAVFLHGGLFYAIDADCPHQGAGLELGEIEDAPGAGPCVSCPRHGWCFELATGYCEDIVDYAVRIYDVVRLPDDRLCVSSNARSQG